MKEVTEEVGRIITDLQDLHDVLFERDLSVSPVTVEEIANVLIELISDVVWLAGEVKKVAEQKG